MSKQQKIKKAFYIYFKIEESDQQNYHITKFKPKLEYLIRQENNKQKHMENINKSNWELKKKRKRLKNIEQKILLLRTF